MSQYRVGTVEALDDSFLAHMESRAIEMAREAGALLTGYFGKPLDVEYKDKMRSDPVTVADTRCQEVLRQAISCHFPDHGILGEEDDGEDEHLSARDFTWVLDPLDGTRNFLSGLPIYASSIAVIHKGVPVVGAVFVPWPSASGGTVLHARRGGGAFIEQEPISVLKADEPMGPSLIALPGSFGAAYRFRRPMHGKVGELRIIGSIAYEEALTAMGVVQYSITLRPHLWDVAGSAVLIKEAGGMIMRGRRARGLKALTSTTRWETLEALVPSWRSGETTTRDLRQWSESLVMGSPGVVRYVTSNLKGRTRLTRRLSRAARRFKPRMSARNASH